MEILFRQSLLYVDFQIQYLQYCVYVVKYICGKQPRGDNKKNYERERHDKKTN